MKLMRKFFRGNKKKSDRCVALVGMNAVGKSNFGKRLSSKLKLNRIDIDQEFIKRNGIIKDYISKNGEENFRKLESQIIIESLKPGNLIITGGGAIESDEVRSALKNKSAVIWIRAGKEKVKKHIAEAKKERHEFADKDPDVIASDLLAKRNPLYKEVADITIHERVPFSQYLTIAIAELGKFYKKD
ncbi:MAG: shikimate kinase [Candidatus Peribacteraceae bacterium]|mgnify:FL=1|jgi:shikimate kinase|nr:shikimate kinase [Candidatus Peribacteraceae bacterium]MDP7645959.1 shikimate kinase [Candidatus Peribacteraceae bacterium]|tara:strand:+ start:489 stop:1049 length:561 start_codon:yes stop_codon:yes gene_type:complete